MAAYAGFVLLGLAGGLFTVVSGTAWARSYGFERLGGMQGSASLVQILAAAICPLPLALSLGGSGSYLPGTLMLVALAAGATIAAACWRDPRHVGPVGAV
jgi:hypothetical protein